MSNQSIIFRIYNSYGGGNSSPPFRVGSPCLSKMKPLQIYKGEIRSIGCIIQRNDGVGFHISSATYDIRDYEGNVLVEETAVDGWEDVSTTDVARYRVYKTIEFDYDPKTTLFVHFWINVSSRIIGGVVEVRING